MDLLSRIVTLLSGESVRHRIAAALVLGELGQKPGPVIAALSKLARDEQPALAEPALEALGRLKAQQALPVLLEALERKELAKTAAAALSDLGEEALPALREKLANAAPDVRALVSGLLPSMKGSFSLVLEGLKGQPWEAVSKAALAVRHSVRSATPKERQGMAQKVTSLLPKLEESALRGALKILGYLELPESAKTLETYLSPKQPPLVRVEAVTALRFSLGEKPPARAVKLLVKLLEDPDAQVSRAARDTLTVLHAGPELLPELVRIAGQPAAELALWAIGRLGAAGARDQLAQVAQKGDRARAEAAVRALSALPESGPVLAAALAKADEEHAAQALAEALEHIQLSSKELARLSAAGAATLGKSLPVARRQLEPLRRADPAAWAQTLRTAAARAVPAKAEALRELLARSGAAAPADRFAWASLLLQRGARESAFQELEKLAASGFPLAPAVEKEKKLTPEARYQLAFFLAESAATEVRAQGEALLEGLAEGKGKIARAAKNKLKLLST